MKTAMIKSLVWDAYRQGRTPLIKGAGIVLLAALLAATEFGQGLTFVILYGFGMSVGFMMYAFHFTEANHKEVFGAFPRRLFTLPVGTRWLVGVPMIMSAVAVTSMYLVWAIWILPRLDMNFPVLWPCLFLIAGSAGFQCLLWSVAERRELKVVLLGIYATLLGVGWVLFTGDISFAIVSAVYPSATVEDTARIAHASLVLLTLAMAGVALWRVEVQWRGHGGCGTVWIRSLAQRGRARMLRPFGSLERALFWHDWRLCGLVLPLAVLMVDGFFLLLSSTVGEFSNRATINAFLTLLFAPVTLAWIIGIAFAKPDFWSLDNEYPVAVRLRPVSNEQLINARMRVGLVSLLLAFVITAITGVLWVSYFGALGHLSHLWKTIVYNFGMPGTPILVIGALLSLFLVGYRGLVGGVLAGFDEDSSWRKWSMTVGAVVGIGLVGGISFLSSDEQYRPMLVEFMRLAPVVLGTVVVVKGVSGLKGLRVEGVTFAWAAVWLIAAWCIEYSFSSAAHIKWLLILALFAAVPVGVVRRFNGWEWRSVAFGAFSILFGGFIAVDAFRAMPTTYDAGGHLLRMKIAGQGKPVVVFEQFGVAPLEAWSRIQRDVSKFSTTVSYDHAGYFGSQPGQIKQRDAMQIVHELRTALKSAELEPPFVMVGYSFGGPYVRVFAGENPGEVSGMVLIDPTQEEFIKWASREFPKVNRITKADETSGSEWGMSGMSLRQAELAEMPDVPITVVTGGLVRDQPFARRSTPRWIEWHKAWAEKVGARHVTSTNSAHDVAFREPELMVEEIRRMVQRTEK